MTTPTRKATMIVESHVTTVSWIPSEAVTGPIRDRFGIGLLDHDHRPPGLVDDLDALRAAGGFRFANRLAARAEFVKGRAVGWYVGTGGIAGTGTAHIGPVGASFAQVPMRDLRRTPEIGDGWVRFSQTAGGRLGLPLPRRIPRPPFFRLSAPLSWTTLTLTLYADGRTEYTLDGASSFPRHWIYGPDDLVVKKTGVTDWQSWKEQSSSPWGGEDSDVVVTAAETALERRLSTVILRGRATVARNLCAGDVLLTQGHPGDSLFLVLDGMLLIDLDGQQLAEVGPGALLGERAVLEGGLRTCTATAATPVRVIEVPGSAVDREALEQLSGGRRRVTDRDAAPDAEPSVG